jgi:hypothetical protein
MAKVKRGELRPLSGWMGYILTTNGQALHTSDDIDSELWSLLQYYSEVTEIGISLIRRRGFNAPMDKKIYFAFRASVRQAYNYWEAAKKLNPRSAALLYYYCFLQLSRAYILLHEPTEILGKRPHHGLTVDLSVSKPFIQQKVSVKPSGIFPLFYKIFTDNPIDPQELSIQRCLSYCSDISHQYTSGGFGLKSIYEARLVMAVNEINKNAWGIIALAGGLINLSKYPRASTPIAKAYQQIELPNQMTNELFNIKGNMHPYYEYLQEINTHPYLGESIIPEWQIRGTIEDSFKAVLDHTYFLDESSFTIARPYKPRSETWMREAISIYIVMFYLSNVVRYQPDYLDHLLDTKEAWLIEGFIKSSPLTFLRNMIAKITEMGFRVGTR